MAARKKSTTRNTPRRGSSVRARAAAVPSKPRPGRQPSKPLAVLYREGAKTVCAMLVHPDHHQTVIESSTGIYAALGALQDRGYLFGSVKDSVPEWARQRVPGQCAVLGCATINSAPFV